MSEPKVNYKGFCEDSTKSKSLTSLEIEFLLCIFEEAAVLCKREGKTEARYKVSEFREIKKLGVRDYDIHIESMNVKDTVLWMGTFMRNSKRFKLFAEII